LKEAGFDFLPFEAVEHLSIGRDLRLSHQTVVSLDKLDNQEVSEIVTVQNLIAALDIQGVVLSLDALHCQKKLAS
jgi:hypothetical protein